MDNGTKTLRQQVVTLLLQHGSPCDEVKGDVARIIFYMATRYMGDPGEPSLNVVDYINNSSDPLIGKLSTLLEWNEQDPVDI